MNKWIAKLFEHEDLLRMGHCQRRGDLNLGMGWLYYGLARLVRPAGVVVIGSYRGFSPLVLGQALADNQEGGTVYFIDPSLVDDFWKDEAAVQAYFSGLGVTNVKHFLQTTQEFAESEAYRSLDEVGLVFIDGYHTAEQARCDFETFRHLVPPTGVTLFHDSVTIDEAKIYGAERAYERNVRLYIDELRKDASLQVFDLPFARGLTLVRSVEAADF